MKSKKLDILVLSTFIIFLFLSIIFYIALFMTKQDLFLILGSICSVLMIGVPCLLVKCIKIDVLKELEEKENRTTQQELIYQFLKGEYGQFLSLDEYDFETEVYINFANIGYIKKEYDGDPYFVIYIQLFKKYFEIRYIRKCVKQNYEDFNNVEDIFKSIKEHCNRIAEK